MYQVYLKQRDIIEVLRLEKRSGKIKIKRPEAKQRRLCSAGYVRERIDTLVTSEANKRRKGCDSSVRLLFFFYLAYYLVFML